LPHLRDETLIVVGRDGGQYAGGTKPVGIGEFLIEILLDQVSIPNHATGTLASAGTRFAGILCDDVSAHSGADL
jgi:hypothetical protein